MLVTILPFSSSSCCTLLVRGLIKCVCGVSTVLHVPSPPSPPVSTIGYTLWLGLRWRFFLAILYVLLGDCLLNGAVIATIMW